MYRFTGRRRPGPDWLVPLAFGLLAAMLFWRLWAPGADRLAIGGPEGDFLRQFYAYRAFVARAWASLQVPFWNPHQYAGTPAWADPQAAVIYPWRLLQAPLALGGRTLPLWSVHLEAVAHVALAGWFTYLLVRRLGAGRGPAFLAGATFAFGGYLTGYPVEQLAVVDTAAWLPAVLWALTAATTAAAGGDGRGTRRWTVVAGLAMALAVLAGHPQTAMYGAYAGLGWLLWRAWRLALGWRRGGALVVGWAVLAVGLAAAAWWPAADFLARSARQLDDTALAAGLPLRDVAQVLVPHVLSQWSPLYVGVVGLLLAAWALRWAPAARPWLTLAAVAWWVSLGGGGGLYPVLYRLAPGFALFRQQERIAVLVSLGLAVAAGLALEALLAAGTAGWRRLGRLALGLALAAGAGAWVGVVGADTAPLAPYAQALAFSALVAGLAAATAWLAGSQRLRPRTATLVLVLLVLLDLFSVNRGRALAPGGNPYTTDGIVALLKDHARDGRVSSEGRLPGGPNAASVHGLSDTTGDSPLQLGATANLVATAPEMVWWRLLAVRYLVTDRSFAAGAPVAPLARAGDNVVYEVQLPVPPAWVPTRVTVDGGAWHPGPDFDPLAEAVVPAAAGVAAMTTGPGGTAQLTGLAANQASVAAELPAAGLVAVSVAHDRGWRARATGADGRVIYPAVVPAYGALLAVALPAGRWQVEWTYRPTGVLFGLFVTLVAMLLGAGMWSWPYRRTA